MEKFTAIVLAAGKGSRMHSDVAKQFLELCGRSVLYYSLMAFEESSVDDIILVTGAEDIAYCKKEIITKYHFNKVRAVVEGGAERYWSVKNGLQAAHGADYVLIHDAARPCLTRELIERSIIEVVRSGACTVGVPVKDTIKVVDSQQYGIGTPDRSTLWQIQTPQSFRYQEIISAYEKMEQSGDTDITDDTMIIERYLGKKTKVILGDYSNLKITTPEDLAVAEIFLGK
ncbi:MAG: 2-C-methyl-D-erythritol 4-phosphate cytidylyltransferase [Lachnospiraceae bacterium]|nr:2-C-methyl-D-erythritol 4-phosphate cytidylyltransferase [Lachnospiraceae bacterium]MDE6624830.1 2-C-methyl-D-erythritol 4-phosphate cytidylyltransferase [Lachnospiraceae bacterium]